LDGRLKQHSLKTARLTTDPTMAELFASYCTALEPRKQPDAKEMERHRQRTGSPRRYFRSVVFDVGLVLALIGVLSALRTTKDIIALALLFPSRQSSSEGGSGGVAIMNATGFVLAVLVAMIGLAIVSCRSAVLTRNQATPGHRRSTRVSVLSHALAWRGRSRSMASLTMML
jgi:hypothetical protein